MTAWPAWLRCPVCHGILTRASSTTRCLDCGTSYSIVDEIPILLRPGTDSAQAGHFDEPEDPEFEIERPRGTPALHRWILDEKARRSLTGLENRISGWSALTVCGGSGMDAEWLAGAGAQAVSSDIALGAARRAGERSRRHGVSFGSIVADATALPAADRSIDLVYVHDGLHHLERPQAGLSELLRVCRRAVSITEPSRATATAIAIRLGLAREWEESGNRIARQSLDELVGHVRAAGFRIVRAERYALYYRHRPGRLTKALSLPLALPLARAAWRLVDRLLGRAGNKLVVVALRDGDEAVEDREGGTAVEAS
jgi:ubiquinone/menaquinone biosynthesis C-methylase UbiE/uncharacterized protein YbaR (Trm112 family)